MGRVLGLNLNGACSGAGLFAGHGWPWRRNRQRCFRHLSRVNTCSGLYRQQACRHWPHAFNGYDFAAGQVRVNALCPGTVDTPMRAWLHHSIPIRIVLYACANMHPLGRIARPEEIGEVVAFSHT